jgi:hypothetical protein
MSDIGGVPSVRSVSSTLSGDDVFKNAEERAAERKEREAEQARELSTPATTSCSPGETSTARVFISGDATVVSGVTVGVYLFRNGELPESAG